MAINKPTKVERLRAKLVKKAQKLEELAEKFTLTCGGGSLEVADKLFLKLAVVVDDLPMLLYAWDVAQMDEPVS